MMNGTDEEEEEEGQEKKVQDAEVIHSGEIGKGAGEISVGNNPKIQSHK